MLLIIKGLLNQSESESESEFSVYYFPFPQIVSVAFAK